MVKNDSGSFNQNSKLWNVQMIRCLVVLSTWNFRRIESVQVLLWLIHLRGHQWDHVWYQKNCEGFTLSKHTTNIAMLIHILRYNASKRGVTFGTPCTTEYNFTQLCVIGIRVVFEVLEDRNVETNWVLTFWRSSLKIYGRHHTRISLQLSERKGNFVGV